jgi:hypothetical protein
MLIIYAVMAGHSASEDARERAYVPAIHVFKLDQERKRGCPAAQTSLRSLRKLDCVPGMTNERTWRTADAD